MKESYYAKHAKEYIDSTFNSDLNEAYAMFEPFLPNGAKILDVGFGSARDMLHFSSKGYEVKGIDLELAFVEHAKSLGLDAEVADLLEYQSEEKCDGIWACASLVHLPLEFVEPAIRHLMSLLKPHGVLFVSMKKGEGVEIDEKGRRMTYVNEKLFRRLGFQDIVLTQDNNRTNVIWINAVYRK